MCPSKSVQGEPELISTRKLSILIGGGTVVWIWIGNMSHSVTEGDVGNPTPRCSTPAFMTRGSLFP